jgi:hypothetical protein
MGRGAKQIGGGAMLTQIRCAAALAVTVSCAPTGSGSPGAGGSDGNAGRAGNSAGGNAGGQTTAGTGGASGAGAGGTTTLGSGGMAAAGSGGGSGGGAGAPIGNGGQSGAPAGSSGNGGRAGGAGAVATGGSSGAGGGGAGGLAGGGGSTGCDWTSEDGKVVLFDGTGLAGWQNATAGGTAQWRLVGDGSMEVVPMNPSTNIQTSMKFDDLCLHLEYMTPMYAASVTGQQRGNSGVYFRRAYEMQVLDSYGQPPQIDGCGAIYGISPPLVVACNMQLVWNTYEIEFKAARWDAAGNKTQIAIFVRATLNGKVVQRDVELELSMTTAGQPDASGPQPFMLQDHGNLVRYRNIWAKIPRY